MASAVYTTATPTSCSSLAPEAHRPTPTLCLWAQSHLVAAVSTDANQHSAVSTLVQGAHIAEGRVILRALLPCTKCKVGLLQCSMSEESGDPNKSVSCGGKNLCLQPSGGILGLIGCILSCPSVVKGLQLQGLALESILIDKNRPNLCPRADWLHPLLPPCGWRPSASRARFGDRFGR